MGKQQNFFLVVSLVLIATLFAAFLVPNSDTGQYYRKAPTSIQPGDSSIMRNFNPPSTVKARQCTTDAKCMPACEKGTCTVIDKTSNQCVCAETTFEPVRLPVGHAKKPCGSFASSTGEEGCSVREICWQEKGEQPTGETPYYCYTLKINIVA
jgi:hypothetical protein